MASGESFDYVIVGGGAAGAILAHRLSEDAATSVCLLEAGPADWHPFLHIPAGFIKVIFNPRLTWGFSTEPTSWTAGRRIPLPQGRTLGGSTSINGLVYNRGQREDFDGWAALGNRGWDHAHVLPYFKRNERRLGAADARYRGTTGPQPVSDIEWIHPLCERFIAGAAALGLPRNPDYHGASQDGVGYFQRTIEGRWRMSSSRSYLWPVRRRANLSIRTGTLASAVVFEGRRAIGVRCMRGRDMAGATTVHARREVLLCAGALNTPKLLELSGVGDGPRLQSLGVPTVHHLPGVGEHLSDHFSVRVVARVSGVTTINEYARAPRLWGQMARWLLGQPNMLALSPSLVHWFARSHAGLTRPDLQGVFAPASYRAGYVGMLDRFPGMTCGVWPHRPHSVGHVHARSADPLADALVQPNYLADERDRVTLLAGVRIARRLLQSTELAFCAPQESLPGAQVQSDDELLDFARRYGVSSYHVNGSAHMGPSSDALAVVDDQLRVHGLHGLRVVDASVMPTLVSANTCAATMMIAEKAADMISGRDALPPEGDASAGARPPVNVAA
jgi:choline dehydrogenase